MSDDGGRLPDDTPSEPARSGETVDEAIDEAAADTDDGGVLRPPEQSTPGTAPVEQVADDAAMTTGRSDGGAGPSDAPDEPAAPVEETATSGGMQSDPGARAADRLASAPRPPDAQEGGRDD